MATFQNEAPIVRNAASSVINSFPIIPASGLATNLYTMEMYLTLSSGAEIVEFKYASTGNINVNLNGGETKRVDVPVSVGQSNDLTIETSSNNIVYITFKIRSQI